MRLGCPCDVVSEEGGGETGTGAIAACEGAVCCGSGGRSVCVCGARVPLVVGPAREGAVFCGSGDRSMHVWSAHRRGAVRGLRAGTEPLWLKLGSGVPS